MTAAADPELLDQLTPAEQRALDRQEHPEYADYPQPSQGDIESLWAMLRPREDAYMKQVDEHREVRYLRDKTPAKWAKMLQGGRRFHSRISHNEIMRVVGMLARNNPKITIPPSGEHDKDVERATKQTRWANNLIIAMERQAVRPVIRPTLDNVVGDGRGIIEIYMKDDTPYDRIDTQPQDIFDPKINDYRSETKAETNRRLDKSLVGAKLPWGWRRVSPLSCYYEEDEEGICRVLIVEQKPYRPVYERMKRKAGGVDPALPRPGTPGWAPSHGYSHSSGGWWSYALAGSGNNAAQSVQTIRYYDRRWYAYIVGGVLIDGPVEHKLPGVPVFITPGMLTGSDETAEQYQGVTWGMSEIETLINDMMTLQADSAYTFSRPRPLLVAPPGTTIRAQPPVISLTGENIDYVEPGYDIKDAFAGFEPRLTGEIISGALQFWQRSGLNPIAQGDAPGSQTAGYTANVLIEASESMYDVIPDNWCRTVGNIVDFCRQMVKTTIKEKVGLTASMQSKSGSSTEWLPLGPEDVDDTPAEVELDTMADANKLAIVSQKMQLNKAGFLPRREVQLAAGADDPELWDDQLVIDAADEQQAQMVIEVANQIVAMQAQQRGLQPPASGQPGGQPQSGPGENLQANGGAPASPNAPEVAPATTQQQQQPYQPQSGPAPIAPSTARAGQAQTVQRINT